MTAETSADQPPPAAPPLERIPFRGKVGATWLLLLALFVALFLNFDLKLSIILDKLPYLVGWRLAPDGFLQGAAMTLYIWVLAGIGSFALGLVAALGRLSRNAGAFGVSTFYTSFFRGTPLLVQIYLIYQGLPQIGLVLSAVTSGVIALALNYGAYQAEIVRAGILAIPVGQRDAAAALGLTRWQIMWKVILPQAMRVIVPPTGNQMLALMKETSLVSIMGVWEMMFLARSYGRADYRYIEMMLTVAVLYWIMTLLLEWGQRRIEQHYGRGYGR